VTGRKDPPLTRDVPRRTIAVAAVLALILAAAVAVAALRPSLAGALAPVPATPTSQHFYAVTHTNFGGFATVNLQAPVNPADVVIKVASGATNLGGEDPSFATVNFAGFVDQDTVRVRVIGWHANVVTGIAEFRYYSNKDVTLAVDVYPRTAPSSTSTSTSTSTTSTSTSTSTTSTSTSTSTTTTTRAAG
jgi:hypothetical protein